MRKRMLTLVLVLTLTVQGLTVFASESVMDAAEETDFQTETAPEIEESSGHQYEEEISEGEEPAILESEEPVTEVIPKANEEQPEEIKDKANPVSLEVTPTPSQAQINDFVRSHPFSLDTPDTWEEQPVISITEPKAGRPSAETLANGLNCMNSVRYAAGVSADVILDDNYIAKAQAGTTLLAAIGQGLTHDPQQPAGMPKAFYDEGYEGTHSSNLGLGHNNVSYSVLSCLADSSSSNEQSVGHRRWLLDTRLAKTGFGTSRGYYATYVVDRGRMSKGKNVVWPAANTPVEFLATKANTLPWSISFGGYGRYDVTRAALTLTNLRTGISRDISYTGDVKTGIRYDTVNYGDGKALIFSPGYTMSSAVKNISAGDQYRVDVTGIIDNISGQKCNLQYNVNFFSLDKDVRNIIEKEEEDDYYDDDEDYILRIDSPVTKLAAGKSVKLSFNENFAYWSVSNKKYASISSSGKLTAKKAGAGKTVTVTAETIYGGASIKIKIMKGAVSSVKLSGAKALKAGKSMKIKAKVKATAKPANTKLKWSVNNSSYAKISSSGKLTAKASGKGKTVTVTAKSTDGTNKTAKLKVKIK